MLQWRCREYSECSDESRGSAEPLVAGSRPLSTGAAGKAWDADEDGELNDDRLMLLKLLEAPL